MTCQVALMMSSYSCEKPKRVLILSLRALFYETLSRLNSEIATAQVV
jgi:hypothetical protein